MNRSLFLAWCLLIQVALTVNGAERPPLIPLRDFFKNPVAEGYKLSPSGEHIAFLKSWENRMNIHVQKIGDDEVTRITSVTERDIPFLNWANDDQIIYSLDQGGDENFHLYLVGRDGADSRDLTPYPETKAELIDILKHDPERIIISHNRRDKRVFDAFRVNVKTGESKMIVENPGTITTYLADHEGKLRVATTSDGVNTSLLYRDNEEDEFKAVLTTNFRQSLTPLLFTFDNKNLYVASNLDRDKEAIAIYDPKNAREVELIYEHPQVDVNNLLWSDKRDKVTGVGFVAARRAYRFFDEQRKNIQEFLEERLPGVEVAVVHANLDEDRFVVRTFSDRSRGSYYVYDHNDKALTHLADVTPWLKPDQLSPMSPVVYQSRDGFLIPGYLTLPTGIEPRNLPTVIVPHGGPWARDVWGFRPDVQFLANRGYAVLQMNFRGSTGFGRKFWESSFKEWGKSMQDDVTDGVKWLIDQGIADPKRIGIFGGSYGGYVVLAGLAFTPDLYACGVDYVGVANLFTILETIPPYWEPMREMLYEMMGHPEKDKDVLKAASPVFHAEKIKAPLLIAQGARDPRVKQSESDQVVEALRKRGVEVPYMVKENEGHGFRNEENRFDVYRAMEQFFEKHLGGRSERAEDILSKLYRTGHSEPANK